MTTHPTTSGEEREQQSFDNLPLSDEVRRALDDMGYVEPTPVQIAVWEPAAAGRDVVVQARTGTGKTSAFGLPLVDRRVSRSKRAVQALVLCPTRELALQVSRELSSLGEHKGVETIAIYGGAAMGPQIAAIEGGAQVVAGTPGRVLDHLRRGTMDPSNIRALVLDESDEMLSMGFERELTAILDHLPEDRQTLLFSATVPPDIERMARTRLREPDFIILSSDQVGALEIRHFVYWVAQDKPGELLQVIDIEDPESAIVFCNTREATERVAQRLKREGYDADWLNGDLPQAEREKVMKATREGRIRFLVATDVAARGIDISHLTHVINFDFPQDAESYVHRTGRTGRAGRTGTAISLVTPQEVGALYILRLTYKIRPIERQLPTQLEQRTRAEADIVTSLAATFAPRGQEAEHRALARRLLSHDDAESVLAGMLREHLTTNPELPELAQSRRRGKNPAPMPEAKNDADKEPRRRRKRRKAKADDAADAGDDDGSGGERAPTAESSPKSPAPPDAAPAVAAEAPVERPRNTATSGKERPAEPDGEGESETAEVTLEGIELHVNAGRRNGLRARNLKTVLADAGVDAEQVFRVRVRDRHAFIEVAREVADAAIEALDGAEVADQRLRASISSRSRGEA